MIIPLLIANQVAPETLDKVIGAGLDLVRVGDEPSQRTKELENAWKKPAIEIAKAENWPAEMLAEYPSATADRATIVAWLDEYSGVKGPKTAKLVRALALRAATPTQTERVVEAVVETAENPELPKKGIGIAAVIGGLAAGLAIWKATRR